TFGDPDDQLSEATAIGPVSLTAGGPASPTLAQIAARFHEFDADVTGATIITHGFQLSDDGGNALSSLAQAVRDRADVDGGPDRSAWLLDYTVAADGAAGHFDLDSPISRLPSDQDRGHEGELVLLFDWAPESNELS